MSTKFITNYISLLAIVFYYLLYLTYISSEPCEPGTFVYTSPPILQTKYFTKLTGAENCEKYLTIYLQTNCKLDEPFPPDIFQTEFITFASAFHYICEQQLCEIEHMTSPMLYFIRTDTSTSTHYTYKNNQYNAYSFEFGINLFCPDTNPEETSRCNEVYNNNLNEQSYGLLIEA